MKDILSLKLDVNLQGKLIETGKGELTSRKEKAKVGDTVMLIKGQAFWSARVRITEIRRSPAYKADYADAPNDWSIEVVEAFNPKPEALAFWLMH